MGIHFDWLSHNHTHTHTVYSDKRKIAKKRNSILEYTCYQFGQFLEGNLFIDIYFPRYPSNLCVTFVHWLI